MKPRARLRLEEPQHFNLVYIAFVALMIGCGLVGRAIGILPIQ